MSLAISVNLLAFYKANDREGYEQLKQEFGKINLLLASQSLPIHLEPETLPQISHTNRSRPYLRNFSSSWIHYLRRAIAYWKEREPLTPCLGDPIEDDILKEEYYMLRSHIICHSDTGGFYLPIDFNEPLFDPNEEIAGGGILGSSYRVIDELMGVAPAIGIELLDKGRLSDEQAARLSGERNETVAFGIERQVWFTLYENAKYSVEHGTAIVLH